MQADHLGWLAAHYAALNGQVDLVNVLSSEQTAAIETPWGASATDILKLVQFDNSTFYAESQLVFNALLHQYNARARGDNPWGACSDGDLSSAMADSLRRAHRTGAGKLAVRIGTSCNVGGQGLFLTARAAAAGSLIGLYGSTWKSYCTESVYLLKGPDVPGAGELGTKTFFDDCAVVNPCSRINHGWPPTVTTMALLNVDGVPMRVACVFLGYVDGDEDKDRLEPELFTRYPTLFGPKLWHHVVKLDLDQIVRFFTRNPIRQLMEGVREDAQGNLLHMLHAENLLSRLHMITRDFRMVLALVVIRPLISLRQMQLMLKHQSPVNPDEEALQGIMYDTLVPLARTFAQVRTRLTKPVLGAVTQAAETVNRSNPARITVAVLTKFVALMTATEGPREMSWWKDNAEPTLRAYLKQLQATAHTIDHERWPTPVTPGAPFMANCPPGR